MEETVVILELRELLHDECLKEQFLPFFDSFNSGNLDNDIQMFLKKYALEYEKTGISRTILFFNENRTELLGYFSLGVNTMHFSEEIKEFAGFKKIEDAYPGINLFENDSYPIYKLFMIGKNFNANADTKGFMNYCFDNFI